MFTGDPRDWLQDVDRLGLDGIPRSVVDLPTRTLPDLSLDLYHPSRILRWGEDVSLLMCYRQHEHMSDQYITPTIPAHYLRSLDKTAFVVFVNNWEMGFIEGLGRLADLMSNLVHKPIHAGVYGKSDYQLSDFDDRLPREVVLRRQGVLI